MSDGCSMKVFYEDFGAPEGGGMGDMFGGVLLTPKLESLSAASLPSKHECVRIFLDYEGGCLL